MFGLQSTQPGCIADRLREGDKELLNLHGHSITINEFHAAVLGLVGLVIGERGLALGTIAREPHYFIGAFVASYAIGRAFERRRN